MTVSVGGATAAGQRSIARTKQKIPPTKARGVGSKVDFCTSGLSKLDETVGLGDGMGQAVLTQIVLFLLEHRQQQANGALAKWMDGLAGIRLVEEMRVKQRSLAVARNNVSLRSGCPLRFLGCKVFSALEDSWFCGWEKNSR